MPPISPVANLSFVRTLKPIVNSLKQGLRMPAVLRTACWLFSSVLIATTVCQAQNIQHTENKPDLALRGDVRVDPSTLGMSFSIPLASYPGRAGHGLPVAVTYSSKSLRLAFQGVDYTPVTGAKTWTGLDFAEHSTAGWTSTLDPPRVEFTGMGQYFDGQGHPACADVCFPGQNIVGNTYIKRIHIHFADGSSHELRQDDEAHSFPVDPFTGTFYGVDGSRMRFESGAASVLYMPDGSKYLFGAYNIGTELTATHFIDRNGNILAYNAGTRQWSDTLGRVLTNPLPSNPAANSDTYFQAKLVGGADTTYTFRWKYLADVLTPDPVTGQPPPLRYPGDNKCSHNSYQNLSPSLFTSDFGTRVCVEQDGAGNPLLFNPVVLAEIVLPTGKSYRFSYTVYGEIDKIVLTTGATERFRYNQVATLSSSTVPYSQSNRGVIERRVSATGSTADESVWTYAVVSTNPYTVRTTQPDLVYSERLLHRSRYSGNGEDFARFEFDDARMGMAYEERSYNSSGVMLRRQLSQWVEGGTPGGAARDPKLTRQVSILLDAPGVNALTTATQMTYDADFNVTSSKRYDFVSLSTTTAQTAAIASIANGALLRTQETDYVTDTAYRARQLLGLPVETRVRDGAGNLVAKSSITYDEYAQYPLLTYGAVTGWQDPSTNVRGNATTVSTWLNTTNSFLSAHTQYDQCGNVRNVWDARDVNQTNSASIDYSATYQHAYPTASTSADPDGAAPFQGLTSSTEYDFSTGLVTAQVDENGQRTSFTYNDPLNRLKQVIRAETVAQTSYSYDDTARTITATADLNFFNDNALKTMSLFDGLGRAIETRFYEDSTNYIASQTQYDALGRAFKASNPFRPLSETAVWTTEAFDALGRVTSMTTPDTAVVTTSYSGTSVTVTDQTGKQRQSVTDALGRLVKVYEAPNDPQFNYLTQYAYDTLDNLTTVTQDSQTRTFVYDSLKRLTSATNPESGTITYQYDNNSNLLVKTDARSVSAHYEYDRLNRLTRRWYNSLNSVANTTHNVPTLPSGVGTSNETKFFYDAQALPTGAPSYTRGASLGRLVAQTYGTGSNGDYLAYDVLGRVTLKLQQTGSVNYQVSAVYNRASAVTSMTYPSGRTISNTFDAAGRLTTFSGTLGDGVNRTYANEIIYSPFGGLAKEKFGTATPTPVYNKQFYNVRGQLAEIRVSTSYTGPTDYDANRGAIVNNYSSQCTGICAGFNMPDNNGNLVKQEIYIPNQTMRWQQYEYDSLNRLQSAREVLNGGAEQWKQQFTYDRWGNRTINTAVTYGAGINNKAFSVNTANNRLGVPAGQPGAMSYDAAGNLTNDTYSGAGNRTYDAENKITAAKGNNDQDQLYGYDGSGQRIKRTVNNVETWQVYGLDGELLAEYAANGGVANPQKEYGYRNGQLLISAEAGIGSALPEFSDDFNDNSLNLVSWSKWYQGSPNVTEQSQQLQISLVPSTAGYNGLYSNATYNLTNKMVQVESVQAVSQAGWCENFLELELDANNYLMIQVGAGSMLFRSRVNGVNNQTSIPFDGVAHRFWRIRHEQSTNLIYFETKASNGAWLTRKTVTAGFSLTALRFHLLAGAYGNGNSAPGTAAYDNFKLQPSNAESVSLNIANAGFEAPVMGNGNFQYGPSGGSWSFQNGGGVTGMNSGFTGVPSAAPEGVQVAFIQNTGTVSQSIAGFQSNADYVITFSAIQRTNCCNTGGQDIGVYIDNTQVGTFHPSAISYAEYSTSAFPVTSGAHTVKFVGLNLLGGDHTAFIDNVRITGIPKPGFGVQWLVTDQLGTPRMILDESGALANMKRHDYLPFGEELYAPTGGRNVSMGYASGDGIRQQFTSQERDVETGLDYLSARYYSSTQGRFTSADEPFADQQPDDPQSWNLYAYVVNNPLLFSDPLGRWKMIPCSSGAPRGTGCLISDRKEDTFESLAEYLGVSTKRVKKFFSYIDPKSIQIGQVFEVSCLLVVCGNTPVVVTDLGDMTGVVDPQPKGPSAVEAAIGITAATGVGGSGGAAAGGGTATISGILTTGFHFTQAALEHIVDRHWPSSGAIRTGKFAPGTTARDLKNMIDEAVHKATPQPGRFNRQIFEYDFGRTIGKTSNGVPTSRIRVVLDAAGKVITAFPIR